MSPKPGPKPYDETVNTSIRLSVSLRARLDEIGRERQRSLAYIVAEACREYVERLAKTNTAASGKEE